MENRQEEIVQLRTDLSEVRLGLATLRRQHRRQLGVAVGLVALLGVAPTLGFARAKKSVILQDNVTGQAVELTADGLHFTQDGTSRYRIQVGQDWADMTMWGATGQAAWNLHSDSESTASKIFSPDQHLRVEVSDSLLDSGAGVRLYDKVGMPRATFYAGKWGGKAGLQVTNAMRQPRLDLYAVEAAESVVRVVDDEASSSAELSVLSPEEAMYRYTGMLPEGGENQGALVPVLYLSDDRQDHLFLSTVVDD